MLNNKISRRSMLKGASTFAVVATATAAGGLARLKDAPLSAEAQRTAQIRFITSTLLKYTAGSKTVTTNEIESFAKRFTEANGVVDYQSLFSRIDGEYRLTRLFVKNVRNHA